MSARRMAANAVATALLVIGVLLITSGHPLFGGAALGVFVAVVRS